MKTLNDYAIEVHKANQKWWLDLERPCLAHLGAEGLICINCYDGLGYEKKERNVGEMLMLAVSELSEALEGHQKNLFDDKLPHRTMVEVELADCLIRLFDTICGIGEEFPNRIVGDLNAFGAHFKPFFFYGDNFAENLLKITGTLTEGITDGDGIKKGIYCILGLGYLLGLDLEGAYVEKMAFNAKREDHTIAHRLSAQGKKY